MSYWSCFFTAIILSARSVRKYSICATRSLIKIMDSLRIRTLIARRLQGVVDPGLFRYFVAQVKVISVNFSNQSIFLIALFR